MWKRDLLFLGLILTGLAALAGGLAPLRHTAAPPLPADVEAAPAEYQPVVETLNAQLRQQWAAEGLTPAGRADDLAIARRVALALTGTIPSLQEIRWLEALPPPRRLPEQLDRLFADRRYADYLAERLARATVGTEDGPFLVYRRRRFVTWLSDQLLQQRPYDALVRELIADQGLWTDRPATNFLTVTYDPEKKEPDRQRLAARVARAFLGIRLDCAQCHDHPFQPWKQEDFQGLAAYFGQAHSGFTGIYDGDGEFTIEKPGTSAARVIGPRVPYQPELVPAEGSRRWQLACWVTAPENRSFARATVNRAWALLLGRPLVEPVDDLTGVEQPPRILTLLADDFTAHGYDLQRLFRVITATEAFQLESAADPEPTEAHDRAWAVFPLTRLRPEQVAGALVQSSSVATIDAQSHLLTRFLRYVNERDFVQRYGDVGDEEFTARSGTIPQRLLLMNGELVRERTKEDLFTASSRIAQQAPDDRAAVEAAYLTVLTRRPTPEESAHFEARLAGTTGDERSRRVADLFWTLVNATEFSWNH